MFSIWLLTLFALLYLSLLFAVAFWGDKYHHTSEQRPVVYSLALGVHCTSWTFFGTITQAVQFGWAFVPTYAGSIALFLLGYPILLKILRLCQQHHISSLADFLSLQFSRSYIVAALVCVVCFIGVVPYTALQLDALTNSVELLSAGESQWPGGVSLYVALLMALFAVIFGTRSLSLTEKHPGLMLAMAFESLVKLGALVLVCLFAVYVLFDGVFDLAGHAQNAPSAQPMLNAEFAPWVYVSHMMLGFCSMLIVPRQFHINFVENNGEQELRRARWLFPLYLVLISLCIYPIALSGTLLIPNENSDNYVLALPLFAEQPWLAAIGFIGGLAAASSMIIVATLALGIMIANNLVTPLWLTLRLKRRRHHAIQPSGILTIRRLTILTLLGLSYLYSEHLSQRAPLVNSGILALALMAQLAPPLLISLFSRHRNSLAAIMAIGAGAIGWAVWILWPSIEASYYFESVPTAQELAQGLYLTLLVNILTFIIVSLVMRRRASDSANSLKSTLGAIKIGPLLSVAERVLPPHQFTTLQKDIGAHSPHYFASDDVIQHTEQQLAVHVGNASARILLSAITESHRVPLDELVGLVEEATQTYQFNHELLRASVEHIEQGISVVDHNLKLLAWNQRYISLFHYPQGFIRAGLPLKDILRHNAERGLFGPVADIDAEVTKRLAYIREGSSYKYLRHQKDGRVIELQGNPMPGGGFVTTYSDITDYVRTQEALEDAKNTLEQRVNERTRQLQAAKLEADQANDSKTKFLAAAGHDLMQPFNAATLFADMIKQQTQESSVAQLAEGMQQSLHNAESLLTALLDMTKLDSGRLQATISDFPLNEVLTPLAKEFELMAKQHGLTLHYHPTQLWVRSDKRLLRRIIQNLLSNAMRYTEKGRIVLGVRRTQGNLSVHVMDTGPGIAKDKQSIIFNEFQQLSPDNKQGLGLGLTIVDRISHLLSHPVNLNSDVGKGTDFTVTIPRVAAHLDHTSPTLVAQDNAQFLQGKIVLIVDNEPQILDAMSQLFQQWGAHVIAANDLNSAEQHCDRPVDLMMLDYHLDHDATGIEIYQALCEKWQTTVPGILNSANYDDDIREHAIEHGLSFLHKPIKPGALKRMIRKVLQ